MPYTTLLAYQILLRRGLFPFSLHRLLIKRQHFYPAEASLPASHLIQCTWEVCCPSSNVRLTLFVQQYVPTAWQGDAAIPMVAIPESPTPWLPLHRRL